MSNKTMRSLFGIGGAVGMALSLLLLLFTAVPFASTANANQQSGEFLLSTPLVAEDFNYGNTPGDLTAVSGSVWVAHSSAGTGPVQYITPSLSMPNYGSSGIGGAATISTGGAEDVHIPFTEQTSGILYFAALVSVTEAQSGDYFLHFSNASTGFRARVFVRDVAGVLQYGLSTSTSTATYATDAFDYNTTYLVVAKYDIDSGDTNLFVLDEVVSVEPATPLLSLGGTSLAVQRVAIRQGSAGNRPAATIDGVRVANTWEDVIGLPGAPSVVATNPQNGATNVPLTATIAITFSEVVTVTADWFDLACTLSGVITGTTSPVSPADAYTITPANPFDYDEACTVTVLAAEVSNSTGLMMTADYPFTFTTESESGDITFIYNDLEEVVEAGETVWLAGDFNGWTPVQMGDAGGGVYTYTVTGLTGGETYEYKYVVDDGSQQYDWLNTTNRSVTVSGDATVNDYRNVIVGYAALQWPPTLETAMYTSTADIYGQLYINNVTNPPGEGRGLQAEVGYGSQPDPADWTWFPMTFANQVGDNDEFVGVITPTLPGVFSYTVRFDGNAGPGNPNAEWVYGDLSGVGPYPGGDFDISDTGVMTVTFAAVPIADARAGSNGEIFGLEGVVTAPNSTWNQAAEWTFQDASGGIAAFFLADPPISLGDTVRMVATRGSFNNQEQMIFPLYYFDVVSAGTPPDPLTYTTGQVAAGDSEGWLIYTEGIVSGMPSSCGTAYNITLNDGSGAATVRIEAATGINLCNLGIQNGDMLGVTGFSTQFQSTFQVKPRSVSDLNLFVDVPVVISTFPANNATNVLTDTLITIQFSEPVTVTNDWFGVQCHISGDVSASSSPAGPSDSYTITPDEPFVYGEICYVTILADEVSNDEGLNMFSDYQFSFTVGPAPAFGSCDDPAVPIHFVQGSGLTTPIFGTTVVVEAVVVGSYQGPGQFSGFFLQERDDRVDGDPMTSEGIFVFHSSTAVAPGDLVRVRGTATEFNNLTQIASVTTANITVCDDGYSVTPAEMTLPVDDMMEWEAVEGMLVSFTHDLHVTEHFNLGRFGEVHLSVNDRLWNPTNLVTPGAPALALQDLNDRSRIILDDGLNIQNPDPVIYPDPKLTYTNTLRTGALVHNLLGVVDFRASSYRIQPVETVDFSNTADRPYEMDEVGGTIQVAAFNVLNYFTTLDTGANICGPEQNMGCRGANTAFEFERQRTKIINAILEMDADVVGLIEIENHITDTAVIDIVAGLNDFAGGFVYDYMDTGVIGTDAIKLAFVYQPATVTPVGDYAILDSSIDPRFLDTKNRPVLIQTFAENSTGELFTVAVNHLKSKGSPCDDVGDPDLGDGQGNCNVTRTEATAALIDYLATDPTGSGSDRFLIIGDLNSYAMEDPIMLLQDADYTDLLRFYYGDEAYTYVFNGQFGHLDYALASAEIMPFVTGATAWHINADEPRVLDYNVEFKSAGQIIEWYSPEPFRSSDHDPVIVGLTFPPQPDPTVTILSPEDGAIFVSDDGTAVTVPVVITTTDFVIPDDGHWHLIINGDDTGPVMDYETTVDLLPGVYTITAELHLPDHTPLAISDSVMITVEYTPDPDPTVTILSPEDGAVFISEDGSAVTVPVVITTTDFVIPDDGHWHLIINGSDTGPVMAYETTVDLLPGVYTITAELHDCPTIRRWPLATA
jgi:predicted extracellular nuclease/DNA/RNA endonuclease YhcR with UshA esterase domain